MTKIDYDPSKLMVWVDIETTGLDVNLDYILEVGLKVTNEKLVTLAEHSWLVNNRDFEWRLDENDYVKNMHTKSGLLDEIRALPEYTRTKAGGSIIEGGMSDVDTMAWHWLTDDLGLEPGRYPMCGSSVSFDHAFIDARMTMLGKFFTYRNIDVSTVKELCKLFAPDFYSSMRLPDKKAAVHRVLPDIDASINELNLYRGEFLFDEVIMGMSVAEHMEEIAKDDSFVQESLPGL